MVYLSVFHLPTLRQEEDHDHKYWGNGNDHSSAYPYGIFPFKKLSRLEFSDITVFCGGNGSGKTTLLNLIAEALHLPRITPFNRSTYFSEYIQKMCSWEVHGGEHTDMAPYGSAIYTSDDIFYNILDRRVQNEETKRCMQDAEQEYRRIQKEDFHFHSMEDYDALLRKLEVKKRTVSQYVRRHAGEPQTPDSNGECALRFFRNNLQEHSLYLLDEPENSLSPKYQLQLVSLLEEYVRFWDCQFILSTHSPFLMSMKEAVLYDLDAVPAEPKHFWELESMQIYYQFFRKYKKYFEL